MKFIVELQGALNGRSLEDVCDEIGYTLQNELSLSLLGMGQVLVAPVVEDAVVEVKGLASGSEGFGA